MSQKNNKKKDRTLVKYLALCLLFVVFSVCVFIVSGRAFEYRSDKNDVYEPYLLASDETITQKFSSSAEEISGISIGFMTYGRINSGLVSVALCEDSNPIRTEIVEASYLSDNEYHDFRFDSSVHTEEGHDYSIQIKYEYTDEENTVAIITSRSGNSLSSSGVELDDCSLCYQLIMINSGLRFAAVIVFLIVALLGLGLLIKKLGIKTISIPKVLFGSVLVVLIIEFVSVDLLGNTMLDILSHVSRDTQSVYTINPGASAEYPVDVTYSRVNRLGFSLKDGDFDNINIRLVNSDTGFTYTDRHLNSDEIIQDAFTGKTVMLITADSCGQKEFPLGKYSVRVSNTSSDTPLTIETTEIGSGETGIFNIQTKYTWTFRLMAYVMLIALAVYLYLVFVFSRKNPMKPENLFLLTVIPLGAIYFVLFQPWSVPDTNAHFEAIYRITNTVLGCTENNGWMITVADNDFYNNVWHAASSYPCTHSILGIIDNLGPAGSIQSSGTNMIPICDAMEQMEYYTIINYFPMVIGFVIGRLLNLGMAAMLYIGRFLMWVYYISICYYSIRITPVGKHVFTSICLLPMSLMMSNSLSYDAMVIVSTVFFTASVLRIRNNASIQNLIVACVSGLFIGGVKGGGYLILLVLLLVLWNKKEPEKSFKTILAVGAIALLAFMIFNMFIPKVKLYQFGTEGSEKLSTTWGITHPIDYINMSITAYLDYADMLIINIGGTILAWDEFTIENIVIVILMVTALIASVFEKDELVLNKRDKLVFISTVLIAVCFTPLMLLSWTNVNSVRIEGLQGRYYLPVLPLMIMVLSKFKLKNASREPDSADSIAVLKTCQRLFAVVSVLCVYYLMRLYLTR